MPSDRQGLIQLPSGDAFTRVNGRETLVTRGGDMLTVSNSGEGLRMAAPGAKIEQWNSEAGKFEKVAQLPGSFG